MDYVRYKADQVELVKRNLLVPHFQKLVDAGEMSLLTALLQQAKINTDIATAREQIATGEYVEAGDLVELVAKQANEKLANMAN